MTTVIDWDKSSQGGEFTVYPKGTYKVTINDWELVKASTGTEQIRWKATILDPDEFVGKPFTTHTPLTPASLWKIARLVKACGINVVSLGKMEVKSPSFWKVLESCKRRTAYWHFDVKPNNKGKEVNEVDDFRLDDEQDITTINQAEDIPPFLQEG